MYFFTYFAAFLLLRQLRKVTKFTDLFLKWDTILNYGSWGGFVILGIAQASMGGATVGILGAAYLGGILYYLNQEPDFIGQRALIQTHYPLVATALISALVLAISPAFYDDYQSWFNIAVFGAFVWTFARSIGTKKQNEQIRITNERRAQLEKLVAERTAEITIQRNELEEAVKELKSTQAQLIQQEKLASLGELTAGIAHEIQNPLNFVNNFSEVSTELLLELKTGPLMHLPEKEREYADEILQDLTQNLEKITHHGKRADSIVKGMLQHSRANTGQKELVNLGTLADEYIRLSYHGFRAKEKMFNASIKTNFDPSLKPVLVIPQDIGRLFLNLLNNAFYAMHQKQRTAGAGYSPEVEFTIAAKPGVVEIMIKDNGTGIPDNIREKILQPFFTTKPTGEGTGLGLSLSYDIVVKGHGGNLNIDSQDGLGTTFTIQLPVQK